MPVMMALAAYTSQASTDRICTGSHDQKVPHATLARIEPVMMPMVNSANPQATQR